MEKLAPADELKWLDDNPRLEELMKRYPAVWEEAGLELMTAAQSGRVAQLNDCATKAKQAAELWKHRIFKSRNNPKVIESALPHIVRSRMSLLTLDKCFLAANAGRVSGKVRFNLFNGLIIQKLLFSRHLTRKPASLRLVRFWWRFLTQQKLLMPLVQDKGIYCFYTKELIRELTELIGGQLCLEIAAGDGTLARFLKDEGVQVTATDDLSWSHAIDYPENVENLSAKKALAKYQPPVVICSWPPPGNTFERQVFVTKSVKLYIVIGSRYRFVSGNWDIYEEQDKFDWRLDEKLSSYVLPPEQANGVLVFRRKS